MILGNMCADEDYYNAHFYKKIQDFNPQQLSQEDQDKLIQLTDNFSNCRGHLHSKIFTHLRDQFQIVGPGYFIQSACASSHSAIHSAFFRLKNQDADLVYCGGAELNLNPSTFVSFATLGALSSGGCKPFDEGHDGIVQGEGCGVIALQRKRDAIRYGHTIHGIIRSVGSSSDNNMGSLFAPTVEGQLLAYRRAYQNISTRHIDYIESHGTGTVLGDETEIKSLRKFFGKMRIPIGSSKALIGHTRGAAGIFGLLKGLLILKNRLIPGSEYFTKFGQIDSGNIFVNKTPIQLHAKNRPMRIGCSSFGFGGCNSHIVLESQQVSHESSSIRKTTHTNTASVNAVNEIAILSTASVRTVDTSVEILSKKFRMPVSSLVRADSIQIKSLIAASVVLERLPFLKIEKNRKISVYSAFTHGIEQSLKIESWLRTEEFVNRCCDRPSLQRFLQQEKHLYHEINEDTSLGGMNNIIASRVAKYLKADGINFNIDSEQLSFPCALSLIKSHLHRCEDELIFLLWSHNKVSSETPQKTLSTEVHCWALCLTNHALQANFPIKSLLRNIHYRP